MLGEDPRTIFLGQTVRYPGSAMYGSLEGVPMGKRIELPVIEDVQMGMSIGLSLEGYIPVSIYPRMDFLICAMNQLVNHLDKIKEMSHGEFAPKVIIRTAIGKKQPLYPGIQHCSDYMLTMKQALKHIKVVNVREPMLDYKDALMRDGSTLLIDNS